MFMILGVSGLFLREKGSLVMEGKGLNILQGKYLASFVNVTDLGQPVPNKVFPRWEVGSLSVRAMPVIVN